METRGRQGEDTPSSQALMGRLDKVLQRLEEEPELGELGEEREQFYHSEGCTEPSLALTQV